MKILIYYFSGTGNTEFVVNEITKKIESKDIDVQKRRIDEVLKYDIRVDVSDADMIGIAYPIYSLNAPRIIFDFIGKIESSTNKKVFIIETAGDNAFVNEASTLRVRGALKRKGHKVFFEELYIMPANFLIRYNANFEKQLYNFAIKKAEKTAKSILDGKKKVKRPSKISKILSFIGLIENIGSKRMGKRFKANKEKCTLCRRCEVLCPTKNISVDGDKVKFGKKCILCMRCIYGCNVRAISAGLFNFIAIKKGYSIEDVAKSEEQGDFVTSKTKGFFKHFYKYFDEGNG